MSRNATPLLRAQPLPELHGGVELLLVESLLAHPDPTAANGHEEERGLCMLLVVEPTEVARRWMRSEAQRYVGARACVVSVPGADWEVGVIQRLAQYGAAFLDMVVRLPEHDPAIEQRVAVLLRRLRAGHHQLGTATAVVRHAAGWSGGSAGIGLVLPQGMDTVAGAIALHAGLAQASAPQLVACVTTEEVNAVFEAPARPATLYLTDDLGLPQAVEVHRRSEHAPSIRFAMALFLDDLGLSGYSAAKRTLRAAGFGEAVVIAPHGLTVPPMPNLRPRCVFVASGGGDDLPISND